MRNLEKAVVLVLQSRQSTSGMSRHSPVNDEDGPGSQDYAVDCLLNAQG